MEAERRDSAVTTPLPSSRPTWNSRKKRVSLCETQTRDRVREPAYLSVIVSGVADDDSFRVAQVGQLEPGLGQKLRRVFRAHDEGLVAAGPGDEELGLGPRRHLHLGKLQIRSKLGMSCQSTPTPSDT